MSGEPARRLYRSRDNRMIAGVAGGIAEYFGISATAVRVVWVIGALVMAPMTAPAALLLYFVLAVGIPVEPSGE